MRQQRPNPDGGPLTEIFSYHREEPALPEAYDWDTEKASFCRKNLLVPADPVRRDGTIETKQSRLERYHKHAGGLVFCHRGLYERASTIIENSTGALENGTQQGYHLHELDAFVWSRLDEAFMAHDQVADRITSKSGPWQQYTIQQILQTLLVSRGVSNAFLQLLPEGGGKSAATTPAPAFSSTYETARDRVLGVLDMFWHDVLSKPGRTIQLDLREHDLAKAIPHYCFHISKMPPLRPRIQDQTRGAHETLIYKMFESTMFKGYNIHFSCFQELEQAIRERSIEQYGVDYFERRHLLLCPPLIMVFFADELVKLAQTTKPERGERRDSYAHLYRVALGAISSFVGIDMGVRVGRPHPQTREQQTATYNFILEIGYSGLGLGYDTRTGTARNPLTGERITDPQVIFDSLVDRALIDVAIELRETRPGVLLASCTRMPDVITSKGNFKASFTTAELGSWPQGEKRIAAELRAIHGGLYPQSDLVVADNPAAEIAARVWIDKDLRLDRKKLLNGPPYYQWLRGDGHDERRNKLVGLLRGLNTSFPANTVGQSGMHVPVAIWPSRINDTAVRSWEEAGALSLSHGRTADPLAPPPPRDNGGDDLDESISPLAISLSGKHGFVIDDPAEAKRAFARLFREAQAARGDGGDAAMAQPVEILVCGRKFTFSTLAYARRSVANLQVYKAAAEGRIAVLQELLVDSVEADIDALTGSFGTALGAACDAGQIAAVRWLLEHGAQPNPNTPRSYMYPSPLTVACAKGDGTLVSLLLRRGAYPNGIGSMAPQTEGYLGTPLLAACFFGHSRVVEMLLKYGADPNTGVGRGVTPLGNACARGHIDIVDTLLVHLGANCDIDTRAKHLSIALQRSAAAAAGLAVERHDALMAKLLAQRTDVNIAAMPHRTPLISACMYGHLPTVQLLLKHGADPNAPDTSLTDNTPLEVGCGGSDAVPIISSTNTTPLGVAIGGRNAVPIIRELLAAGAKVGVGRPLLMACLRRDEDAVELLLRSGAPTNFSLLETIKHTTPGIISRLISARPTSEQHAVEARLIRAAMSGSGPANKESPTRAGIYAMKPISHPRLITKKRPKDKQIRPINNPGIIQICRDEMMATKPVPNCGCLICLLDDRLKENSLSYDKSFRHNPVTYTLMGMDIRPRQGESKPTAGMSRC